MKPHGYLLIALAVIAFVGCEAKPLAVKSRPGQIQGVVAALAEAVEIARAQPADSHRIMAQRSNVTLALRRAPILSEPRAK
jgi:ABC-type nitrate/sulfonate/bicarbonate transport system substrate-binding protein